MTYTLVVQLSGAPAAAIAVEWTDRAEAGADGAGWEPCLPLGQGRWRFATGQGRTAAHLRAPGRWEGIAIRYRLAAAGPWSEASADRKEIMIRAEGEKPADPVLRPALVTAPALAGTGKIGTPVTAEPGIWTGATAFAFEWRRNGAPIPGATAASYTPQAADDEGMLTVSVTATGPGGTAEAVTAALKVTWPAPVATTDGVIDEILDQAEGVHEVAAAAFFSGGGLRYVASGAGATIDAATGRLAIPTGQPMAGESLVVTARNSGGEALLRFLVTVEAAPTGPVLMALGAADWSVVGVEADPAHPGRATAVIAFAPGCPAEGAIAAYWTDTNPPQEIGHPMWDLGLRNGRRHFRLRPAWNDANAWHVRAAGESKDNIAVRYQLEGTTLGASHVAPGTAPMTAAFQDEWASPWSGDRKSFAVPANFFATSTPGGTWRPFPANQLSDATGRALSQYALTGTYFNGAHWGQAALTMALHARSGQTDADARLLAQLRHVIGGSRQPPLQGGYWLQHECRILSAIAVARHVPRVWNALSEFERGALGALMKAGAVTGAFMMSDENPYVKANQTQRPLRGLDHNPGGTSRNWNPNYRLANITAVGCAIAFFGEAAALDFLRTYRHGPMVTELDGFRLTNTHSVFARTWGSSAPSAAQIETALRQFRRHNVGPEGWRRIAVIDTNDCFSKTVSPGLNDGRGVWDTNKQQFRGRIMAGAANLPNRGRLGMCLEFDTVDGGGPYGPNNRSAYHYSLDGARLAVDLWGALAAAGLLDRGDAEVRGIAERMDIGYTDLAYKWQQGYFSYSKGGAGGGNDDWTVAANGERYGRLYSMGLWHDVLRFWFLGA